VLSPLCIGACGLTESFSEGDNKGRRTKEELRRRQNFGFRNAECGKKELRVEKLKQMGVEGLRGRAAAQPLSDV
jgi:hypothetical protein